MNEFEFLGTINLSYKKKRSNFEYLNIKLIFITISTNI